MSTTLLPPRPRKAIGLTALIDVVFILLMFFMLTSSFNQWRSIELTSAAAVTEKTVTDRDEPALIVLQSNGQLLNGLNGEPQTPEQIRARLDTERAAVLLPMASVSVQLLVSTIEQLNATGITRLSLGDSLSGESL